MFDQRQQQVEFAGAQRHRDAVAADEFALVDVEGPALEAVAFGLVFIRRRLAHAVAAQHRADARNQLAAAERLGQIIVGAHFEADDAVDFVAFGGEHDDRDVAFGAQRAAERQPVLARQHQVEQNEIDVGVGQHLAHGLAVGRG